MNPFLNRRSGKSDRDSCSIEDLDDGEEPKKKIPSPWMGRSRRNSDSSETSEETVNTFTKNQGKLDNKNRKGEKHSSTTVSARKSGKSAVSKVIAINFSKFFLILIYLYLINFIQFFYNLYSSLEFFFFENNFLHVKIDYVILAFLFR